MLLPVDRTPRADADADEDADGHVDADEGGRGDDAEDAVADGDASDGEHIAPEPELVPVLELGLVPLQQQQQQPPRLQPTQHRPSRLHSEPGELRQNHNPPLLEGCDAWTPTNANALMAIRSFDWHPDPLSFPRLLLTLIQLRIHHRWHPT